MRIILVLLWLSLTAPTPGQSTRPSAPPLPAPRVKPGDLKFKHPDFTFVRIKYFSGARGRGSWNTDWPDADINLSRRFQEATSLKVDPEGKTLELTDPVLKDYPFIYVAEGGTLVLSKGEVTALRRYLLGGGFLMIDDFWGEREWASLAAQLKRVFPEFDPVDLPIEHPIFRCFYDLKEKPQVSNIAFAIHNKSNGVTWEREDAKEAHYRALIDSKGRIMAILCHNTDLADGWEREGEDAWYAAEFSLKKAYPMGINIAVFALTQQPRSP